MAKRGVDAPRPPWMHQESNVQLFSEEVELFFEDSSTNCDAVLRVGVVCICKNPWPGWVWCAYVRIPGLDGCGVHM